jgi:hypothetical protein
MDVNAAFVNGQTKGFFLLEMDDESLDPV